MFTCPCCGYLIFAEPPGSFEICKICFWEDDIAQLVFPTMAGGANSVSLSEAQANFSDYGVSERRFQDQVRQVESTDSRDTTWRRFDPKADLYLNWDKPTERERWKNEKHKVSDKQFYYWCELCWLKNG